MICQLPHLRLTSMQQACLRDLHAEDKPMQCMYIIVVVVGTVLVLVICFCLFVEVTINIVIAVLSGSQVSNYDHNKCNDDITTQQQD